MKRSVVLILLITLCFSIELTVAQSEQELPAQNTVHIQDSLEIEKLELEISELQMKKERAWVNFLIALIGGTTGFVTILWTIYQGVKNYKIQLSQQKLKTISDLLVLLTDSSPNKRVGAANGLGKYSDYVIDELVASIAIEEEEIITKAIEVALLKIDRKNQIKIIRSNQLANEDLIKLLGELSTTNIPQNVIDSALKLDPELRVSLVRNNRYLYDYGKTIGKRKDNPQIDQLTEDYSTKAQRIQRTIDSTGRIIARVINQQQQIELTNINISYTELYKQEINNLKSSGFYMINTLCRHISFKNCSFKNSMFKAADMFDSSFESITMENCNFNSSNMRQTRGRDLYITNCEFSHDAILSESNFNNLESNRNNFTHAKMNNFVARNSKFEYTRFNSSELNHGVFNDSTINNCDFFGTKIIEGSFSNTRIIDTKFNGSDLRGANFENAHLERVDFSGADLKNIKTENWNLIDCLFDKAKNYNNQA